jgi:hypothetical protein
MNVIAVSVDSGEARLDNLAMAIHKTGMLLRVTFNVTNKEMLGKGDFSDLLYWFRVQGVDQFTLRNVVAPNHTSETPQSIWIKQNVDPLLYGHLLLEMRKKCQENGYHLRSLPYGAEVYDLQGVSVSFSDYCIQDDNNTEDIRSLIFQEDGHVYTSWNSKASILF